MLAPPAFNVVFCPLQMVFIPVIETVGLAFTFTIKLLNPEQPLKSVPITLYVVLTSGASVIETVVCPPGSH